MTEQDCKTTTMTPESDFVSAKSNYQFFNEPTIEAHRKKDDSEDDFLQGRLNSQAKEAARDSDLSNVGLSGGDYSPISHTFFKHPSASTALLDN